jgi:hypothetical protein
MSNIGFAYRPKDAVVDIRTASPSVRLTHVKAIVLYLNTAVGIDWSDEKVQGKFEEVVEKFGGFTAPVTLMIARGNKEFPSLTDEEVDTQIEDLLRERDTRRITRMSDGSSMCENDFRDQTIDKVWHTVGTDLADVYNRLHGTHHAQWLEGDSMYYLGPLE